jgi:hypothetical protein
VEEKKLVKRITNLGYMISSTRKITFELPGVSESGRQVTSEKEINKRQTGGDQRSARVHGSDRSNLTTGLRAEAASHLLRPYSLAQPMRVCDRPVPCRLLAASSPGEEGHAGASPPRRVSRRPDTSRCLPRHLAPAGSRRFFPARIKSRHREHIPLRPNHQKHPSVATRIS